MLDGLASNDAVAASNPYIAEQRLRGYIFRRITRRPLDSCCKQWNTRSLRHITLAGACSREPWDRCPSQANALRLPQYPACCSVLALQQQGNVVRHSRVSLTPPSTARTNIHAPETGSSQRRAKAAMLSLRVCTAALSVLLYRPLPSYSPSHFSSRESHTAVVSA